MDGVRQHYEGLLAKHYTWMFGTSFEAKVAEQRAILEEALRLKTANDHRGLAVDLGCGPGYQALALAQLGYAPVLAVDTSATLLSELRNHQGNLPIQTAENDIRDLGLLVAPGTAQAVVCMGDTITHLASRQDVLALVRASIKTLVPGGAFVITYRDLSEELHGLERFIPVHSDDQRVMTCFLEFDQPESVLVHDLVYTREKKQWKLEKSSYRKLRLPVKWLEDAMTNAGFEVNRGQAGRLIRLVGRKL
jgi:SAM-dependent methyltransferase